MNTVNKIAAKLIELFGSKENALAKLQAARFWNYTANPEQKSVLLYEEGCEYKEGTLSNRGWYHPNDESFCISEDFNYNYNGILYISWSKDQEERASLFKALGGYTGEQVTIEVNRDFGKTISKGNYHTFNAGYGIGSTYYDITVEIGSPLWRQCLWNQVNFTVEGLTEAEFMLPMYNWLHKLLPTNLGSNRRDGHSAFSWNNSFLLQKKGSRILFNGGEYAYTLSGKKIESPMDRDLCNATAVAPTGIPFITGGIEESGTTVTLWEDSVYLKGLLNATVVAGQDKENIKSSYSREDNVNWRKDYNIVGYPTIVGVISCILVEESTSNHWDDSDPTFMWLFPNKDKYVPLGYKRSLQLLKEHGGEIPEFLQELAQKERGFKTSGDGWAVIN